MWAVTSLGREVRDGSTSHLIPALIAAPLILLSVLLTTEPKVRYALVLLEAWLVFAFLIRYAGGRAKSSPDASRSIPIGFSGELGKFRLIPRGDGRRVEVHAGGDVVAEAVASDDGDELLVDFEAVADSELKDFGTAIGQAIEMVAAADEDRPAERHVAGPASWRKT